MSNHEGGIIPSVDMIQHFNTFVKRKERTINMGQVILSVVEIVFYTVLIVLILRGFKR